MSEIVLVGANPGVLLRDENGQPTAFASLWIVEWSPRGAGTALILADGNRVRVLAESVELGGWLGDYFTRHFPEMASFGWPAPEPELVPAEVDLDLERGLVASVGDVALTFDGVLDRRIIDVDGIELAGVPHRLRNVYLPCERATIRVGDAVLPGSPQVGRDDDGPSSSAFLAVAEVWTR